LPRRIDPEVDGIHPLRMDLSDQDWDRIDEYILNGRGDATTQEIEAFSDWLYDELVARIQTHEGITTVQ